MGGAEVGEAGGPCQTPHVRWVQGAPRASGAFGKTCFQACGRVTRAVSVGLCADKQIGPVVGDSRDTAVALNPADSTWSWATPWGQRSQLTAA